MASIILPVFACLLFCVAVPGIPHDEAKRSDDPLPLETTVQQMASDLANLKALVTAQGNRIQQLEAEKNQTVAFTVYIREGTLKATPHGLIRFSGTVTNIGHAYDTNTGVFTTPFDGDYLFLVNVDVHTDYQFLDIMKNGHPVMQGHNDGGASTHMTATVVLALRAGDTITVNHGNTNGTLDGGKECTFSGYRLF